MHLPMPPVAKTRIYPRAWRTARHRGCAVVRQRGREVAPAGLPYLFQWRAAISAVLSPRRSVHPARHGGRHGALRRSGIFHRGSNLMLAGRGSPWRSLDSSATTGWPARRARTRSETRRYALASSGRDPASICALLRWLCGAGLCAHAHGPGDTCVTPTISASCRQGAALRSVDQEPATHSGKQIVVCRYAV